METQGENRKNKASVSWGDSIKQPNTHVFGAPKEGEQIRRKQKKSLKKKQKQYLLNLLLDLIYCVKRKPYQLDHKNFFFGCTGSSLLRVGFLYLWRAGATLQLWSTGFSLQGLLSSCGAQASYCSGFSCGAQALGAQASVVIAHRLSCSTTWGILLDQGSNPVPCIGRWIPILSTTRKVHKFSF